MAGMIPIGDILNRVFDATLKRVKGTVVLEAGSKLAGKVQPMDAIKASATIELIGADEQVDQNDYGGSVEVALGGTYSGEILSFEFTSTESGTGAVQKPEGWLYILNADPNVAAGDTALAAAEWPTLIGKVYVNAGLWTGDANGAGAFVCEQPVPFETLSTLYLVWFHLDGTSLNDGAGDDEKLEVAFRYRRDS